MVVRTFGETGNTFSGLAQETISGGQLVKCVSGATVLTSSNALDSVVEVALNNANGDDVITAGVALTTATSGNRVTVSTEGIYGFYAAADITVGEPVNAAEIAAADAVTQATAQTGSLVIGRALSAAASGQMVLVKFRC